MSNKISVLMPAYNRERYIESAMASILFQTHENLELIIYDDGSTDRTVQIVQDLMKRDSRIRLVIGIVNHGVGYARNRLLDEAKTKYACWQDSDDVSNILRLQTQLKVIKEEGMPLVFTNYTIHRMPSFLKNVVATGAWTKSPGIRGDNKRGFATVMFEMDKVGIFDPEMKLGGEDWKWIDEIQKKYGSCPMIREVLYYIRFHEDRIGAKKRKLLHFRMSGTERRLSYSQMVRTLR